MAEKKIGVRGKAVHSQAKEVVYNVTQFMQKEAEDGLQIPLESYRQRVLAATGVGKCTYQKIVREGNHQYLNHRSFSSPKKSRDKKSPILDNLTPDQIGYIRNIIYDFYITDHTRPTLKCILQKIRDRQIDFPGQQTTLHTLLRQMGFRWRKTSDNKKALMEKYDIRLQRIKFLKKMLEYRAEGRHIIYTDELYIDATHTTASSLSDGKYTKNLKTPISKAKRLVIVHAGGEQGFVTNGLCIFKSGSKSVDSHDDLNHDNYIQWVQFQLLPSLPLNSVLVVDNASHHNVRINKPITASSLKSEMITWLQDHHIQFQQNFTKLELYDLIKSNKDKFENKYQLDAILEQHGHVVLRLPPYHPDLNPIEQIWTSVKNWVGGRNTTFRLEDVEALARTAVQQIQGEEWKKLCEHVVQYEQQQVEREHVLDSKFDEFKFSVKTESDEGDSEESEGIDLDRFMVVEYSESESD